MRYDFSMRSLRAFFLFLLFASSLRADPVTVPATHPSAAADITLAYRTTLLLPETARDQHNAEFRVAGLSGITFQSGDAAASEFLAVMDNSDRVVRLRVKFADDAKITAAEFTGGVKLSERRDFEGIALGDAASNSVFLSYEGVPSSPPATKPNEFPGIGEYSLADGKLLRTLPLPGVFANRRGNFGFEALTRSADGRSIWTGNEEALTVDGPASSANEPTTVRLLHYVRDGAAGEYRAAAQCAYRVSAWHASILGSGESGSVSGLVDLVALPDGRVLALERSFVKKRIAGGLDSRLYVLDFAGATDVSAFDALKGREFTPVTKHLLWSGNLGNMEGLALGPKLPSGKFVLLGVTDNNGIVGQTVVSFEMGLGKAEQQESRTAEH